MDNQLVLHFFTLNHWENRVMNNLLFWGGSGGLISVGVRSVWMILIGIVSVYMIDLYFR